VAWLKGRVGPLLRQPPAFLIVGAQKAGTTSLYHYLGAHPRLQPASGPKELHFFDLYRDRGMGWYLSHFPRRIPPDGRRWFEATPDYLASPLAPARIRRDLGRVKMIAVLREPASRAFSAWKMWHAFAETRPDAGSKADPRSFSEAIDAELAAPDGAADGHFRYVSAGRYAEQLRRYRAHFPASDMLVLNYDEMGRDLGAFLRRICRFLGVEDFPPAAVAEFGGQRHWASPDAPETAGTAATLARLRAHYRPHDEALFDLIGERWVW
jgi:hypothetical protein